MPSKLTLPEYPDTMKTRQLDEKGRLKLTEYEEENRKGRKGRKDSA